MKKRWNGGGKTGVYWHAIETDPNRCHPAQKPLGLMRELVADFSEPGELVCDPYAGSGTTGVACVQLGREFLQATRVVSHDTVSSATWREPCRESRTSSTSAMAASPGSR